MASVLFGIIRPGDADRAMVDASALRLSSAFRIEEVPLGEIEQAELKAGWHWSRVRIRHASGEATISGLLTADAEAFVAALEGARVDWWRDALTPRFEALRSIYERVKRVMEPQRYVARSLFRNLEHDAQDAVGGIASWWPDSLVTDPQLRMLTVIRKFARDPEVFRSRANKAFVEKELRRWRGFFDTAEEHPLTDEQRRAVAVNEDCNLVIAPAGSGKTSVIVAKAGWLVHGGYRRPSDLLLLAFARDARNELEERIRGRLGDAMASGMTVRTFHSLGMSIIGRAEGRRPSLARTAEDSMALLRLLKKIIASLLLDRELSANLLNWFQGQFAPYRSQQDCRTWGDYWDYLLC